MDAALYRTRASNSSAMNVACGPYEMLSMNAPTANAPVVIQKLPVSIAANATKTHTPMPVMPTIRIRRRPNFSDS